MTSLVCNAKLYLQNQNFERDGKRISVRKKQRTYVKDKQSFNWFHCCGIHWALQLLFIFLSLKVLVSSFKQPKVATSIILINLYENWNNQEITVNGDKLVVKRMFTQNIRF
jgi:hypothetical protein